MKMLKKKSSKLNKVVSVLLALAILVTALVIDLPDGSSNVEAAGAYVEYQAHVEDYGWLNPVTDGMVAGTTGKSKQLEALGVGIYCNSKPLQYSNSRVKVRVFYEDGNSNCVSNPINTRVFFAGTTGQRKKVIGVRIKLEGLITKKYSISYKIHQQNNGWLDWVSDDTYTGDETEVSGDKLRVEAIQIKLVPKH